MKKKSMLKSLLAMSLLITSIPGVMYSLMANTKAVEKEESYTKYVDPFVSTEVDYGQLFPGSVVPNGLVKLSPDTYPHATLDHVGYDYKKTQIQGFSHTRIEGVGGQGAGGDILVTPTYVQYTQRPKAETRAMKYEKSTEKAKPGYYKAELTPKTGNDTDVKDDNSIGRIVAEMTSDERTGYHRYTFPKAGNVNLMADLNYTYHGTDVRNAILDVVEQSDKTTALSGRVSARNVGGSGKYTLYFYMETSKPANNVKTWNGKQLDSKLTQRGNDLGAILNFDVKDNEALELKVSLSPISAEQAKIDMKNEINDWDFDAAYKRADKKWNDVLSKIKIETSEKSDPTGELKPLFYTHLYHMFMTPMNATSTTGIYRGTDGKIHEAKDYTHYDSWSLWDDYRKYPMIGLVMPDVYKDMVRSIADALEQGIVTWSHDKQPVPNVRTEHAVALLADGVAKGFADIDNLEAAYEEAKKIANKVVKDDINYVPGRVDKTVEYAYDDWALSLIAKALGKDDESEYFLKRSFNYKNLFRKDAVDSPFGDNKLGLLWTKDAAGNWTPGDPKKIGEHGLYQGSMWQYSMYGSNDVNGLMDLMGGKEELLDALRYLFGEHAPDNGRAMLHNAANEVELHSPYLFNFAGRPDKTQYWVRQIYTGETWNTGYASGPVKEKMYKLSPKGYLETMDDDTGTMAMMFVSAAMGIFPMTPGDTTFQIGSPFFEKVSLDVGNNKTFTIVANNVSPDNMYIQSAKLNGKSHDRTWIDYSEITRGGVLEFNMGDQPSTWAQNGVPAKSSSDNANTATYDKDEIAYSSSMLEESKLNNGSIDQKLSITLKTTKFNGTINEDLLATNKIKVSNLPKGLTAQVILVEENKVDIILSGKAQNHTLNDSIGNFGIEITDKALSEVISDSVRKVKDNIKIMFSDDKIEFSSTTLKESVNDDGSIVGNSTINLSGLSTFSGKLNEDFVETKKVTLTSVPKGLTPKVIKTGDKTAVLSFVGKAEKHDYDVDFGISFADEAFNGAKASQVENSTSGGMKALLLDFTYDKTTDLKKAISRAKLIKQDVYVSSSYDELNKAIAAGENILSKRTITSEEMASAISDINGACESLKLPTNALKRLEAEKSDAWSGGSLKNESTNLGGTYDNAWIQYKGIDFTNMDIDTINVRYSTRNDACATDGRIEVRENNKDGDLLGTVQIPLTSGWSDYKEVNVALDKKPEGLKDICFVLKGSTDATRIYIANIDYLQFSKGVPKQETNIKLEAEKSHSWSAGELKNEASNLGGTYNGAWIAYKDIDFGTQNLNSIDIKYATRTDKCVTDGTVEVREGNSTGNLLGVVSIPQTTGWSDYKVATAILNKRLNGKQDLCFVLKGTTSVDRPYIANVDYMEFKKTSIKSHVEAEDKSDWSAGSLKTEPNKDSAGKDLVNLGGTKDNSWVAYDNVEFDGSGITEMKFRYSHNPGTAGTNSKVDIFLDTQTGSPIGTIDLPTTNGWANYTVTSKSFDKPISGKHKVILVFHTDQSDRWVANVDWLEFETVEQVIEADKGELKNVYNTNEKLLNQASKYDAIGLNHFKEAMNYAAVIIDNKKATDNDVKIATGDLNNSLATLQYKIIFDLSDVIVDMELIEDIGYTSDSYSRLQESIKNAKGLGIDKEYDVYKTSYDALIDAHATLTVLNKNSLGLMIQQAENINLDLYTEKGKEDFIKALNEAKEVFKKLSLTQKEVDDVIAKLDKAMSALILKGVKTELKKAIDNAESKGKQYYTAESYAQLEKMLVIAKEVYSKEDASQEEINKATADLNNAIAALITNPDISTNPGDDNKPGDSDKVTTNDNSNIMLFAIMFVLSAGIYTVLRKKNCNK